MCERSIKVYPDRIVVCGGWTMSGLCKELEEAGVNLNECPSLEFGETLEVGE